jgi:hypothetical protein
VHSEFSSVQKPHNEGKHCASEHSDSARQRQDDPEAKGGVPGHQITAATHPGEENRQRVEIQEMLRPATASVTRSPTVSAAGTVSDMSRMGVQMKSMSSSAVVSAGVQSAQENSRQTPQKAEDKAAEK